MRCVVIVAVFIVLCSRETIAVTNLMNSPIQACVRCICHALTSCYQLQNCARYSIDYNYWVTANAPVVNLDDNPDQNGYNNCVGNDNCIVNTIHNYTENVGNELTSDCNCDDYSDCFDKMLLHLKSCDNPTSMINYAARKRRFESCMKATYDDPTPNC